jgi:hypothetical protein
MNPRQWNHQTELHKYGIERRRCSQHHIENVTHPTAEKQ